jgi:hypothetical protein
LAADGGVRRLSDVQTELADLEVAPDRFVAWLQANGATVVHDLAVLVTGQLADAVERVVDAHGTARTTEQIEADLAAGGRAAVPAALVDGVGLAPLARRTFSSRWGPVTLARDGPQPSRCSIRAVALAAGARPKDTLLLGFSAAGDVAVEVRRGPGQVSPPVVGDDRLVLFPELDVAYGGPP